MTAWQPHLSSSNGRGHLWPPFVRDFPIAVRWAHKSPNTTMLEWFLFHWFLFHAGLLDVATAEHPDQFNLFWHAHASAQPVHELPHP